MKKYLLFVGSQYYANGGFRDFHMDADDIELLKKYAQRKMNEPGQDAPDWYQIVDTRTLKVVDSQGNSYCNDVD